MNGTLSGHRILLTRPEGQVEPLFERLEALGAQVSHFPAIDITPVSPDKADLAAIEQADHLVFVSVNAVRGLKEALDRHPDIRLAAEIAAIGPATEKALLQAGLEPGVVAPPPYNSEALLATRPLRDLKDRRVVLVRGQSGREKLARELERRGAQVRYLEVYRRDPPAATLSFGEIPGGAPEAICIASAETAENLLKCIAPNEKDALLRCPFIAGNSRILNACLELGYTAPAGVAVDPGDDAMFEALKAVFSPRETVP